MRISGPASMPGSAISVISMAPAPAARAIASARSRARLTAPAMHSSRRRSAVASVNAHSTQPSWTPRRPATSAA